MQDIGYWIKNGRIYGPSGYTGFRINHRQKIVGRKGDTRHYIYRDHIYSELRGNTGFYLRGDRIFGPSSELPWEQRWG